MPFDHVLSPVSLGPVELPVRIVSTSHQTNLVHDHVPTEGARGLPRGARPRRVDAIFLKATAVHPTGLLTRHAIAGFRPAVIPAYRRLASTLHAHTRTLGQRLPRRPRADRRRASRPRRRALGRIDSAVPRGAACASRAEIAEIVSGFGVAARRAREGWHDGVEGSPMRHATLPSIALHPDPKAPKVGCPRSSWRRRATGGDRAGASPTTRSLLCHSTLAAGAP
jgi:2,4-dienoyl-CoA reductase-like NADH-dependent reductase (Old Yellow Enzyme family)